MTTILCSLFFVLHPHPNDTQKGLLKSLDETALSCIRLVALTDGMMPTPASADGNMWGPATMHQEVPDEAEVEADLNSSDNTTVIEGQLKEGIHFQHQTI